jgi:elongation factor G
MKVYETSDIRNLAVVGHGDCGKTSLVAAMLYAAGTTDKLGSVPEGTAITDFDPQEIERRVSMALGVAYAEWRDRKINLLDAPGYTNFIGEAAAAMRAADAALIVVHGTDGIAVQTEKMWEDAEKLELPVMFAISHLDGPNSDFQKVLDALRDRYGRGVMPIALPIGAGEGLEGMVCLVTGKALRPKAGTNEVESGDPPADMQDDVSAAHEELIEMVAESDEELMNSFLDDGELSEEQFRRGLSVAIATRAVMPVFAVAGPRMVGAHQLLEAAANFAPSPLDRPKAKALPLDGGDPIELAADPSAPFAAQVFKTYIDKFAGQISVFRVFSGSVAADANAWNPDTETSERLAGLSVPHGKTGEKIPALEAGDIGFATKLKNTHTQNTLLGDKGQSYRLEPIPFPRPVIAYAVHPESKGDDEKIARALANLAEEDPSLNIERDSRTHELMVAGLGIDHVRTAMDKMAQREGVKGVLQKPKVPYLETITKKAQDSYRHKKQTGGAGQFAEVHLRIEPAPDVEELQYESEIFGGSISRNFWPSIEKGIRQVMDEGVVAGYPMKHVKAVIFDGKEHPVDSKDIAFQIAGRQVFKKCVAKAAPVVLEPIMQVTVTCPDENMGDVLGDLNRRRGRVQGSDSQGDRAIVRARVPMAEMLEYTSTLKSITQDRGSFTMELLGYEKVPAEIQKELTEAYKPQESED